MVTTQLPDDLKNDTTVNLFPDNVRTIVLPMYEFALATFSVNVNVSVVPSNVAVNFADSDEEY